MNIRSAYEKRTAERLGPIFQWLRVAVAASIVMLALMLGRAGYAQQQSDAPPSEPILRLNTAAHTAMIRRIATDRENRYAVTASDDKTARVWSLPDGRLLGRAARADRRRQYG